MIEMTLSDSLLAASVRAAIRHNSNLSHQPVRVLAYGHTITLRGRVNSESCLRALLETASSVTGVEEVVSEVEVIPYTARF
jgi:osmotically-inducible protein OsmY